jgi:hypothetical protein
MIGFTAEAAPKPFPAEFDALVPDVTTPSTSSADVIAERRASEASASTSEPEYSDVDRGDGRMVRASVAKGLVPGDLESLTGLQLPEPKCDEKELEVGRLSFRLRSGHRGTRGGD